MVLDHNSKQEHYVELTSRSAFEIAVSLAEYEAGRSRIVLRKKHLELVTEMFIKYQKYSVFLPSSRRADEMGYRNSEPY